MNIRPALFAALLPFLSLSCTQTSAASKSTLAITASSAKAHMLSLSAEDLFYLNQQSPNILLKIDRGESLTIDDVIHMHEAGISSDSMIAIIDYTKTRFELNTGDVIRLQIEGVPFKVINYMIRS